MIAMGFVGYIVLLALGLWAIFAIATAVQHRRHASRTGLNLCPGCSTPNPPHAEFCRQCGRRL